MDRVPKGLTRYCVAPDVKIRDVIAQIDRNGKGIVLVADARGRLISTVTDGDIRRAILAQVDIDSTTAQDLVDRRGARGDSAPLVAPVGTPGGELLKLMEARNLRHIPLVDEDGRIADIALLSTLAKRRDPQMSAVVMAGGFGTRLRPLTEELPKPMVPVDGRPIMERIVEQLREAGIRRVNVATHYKKEMISDHFGDGTDFGVDISYVEEDEPLGTAGALGLVESTTEPLLVINADILTGVDFGAMLSFHQEHGADMTVAVKEHQVDVPYGVVESDGVWITRIVEKPTIRQFVNAGIYVVNPDVPGSIPADRAYDMPELIDYLISEGRLVASFPVHEYWFDIGNKADYEQAQRGIHGSNV